MLVVALFAVSSCGPFGVCDGCNPCGTGKLEPPPSVDVGLAAAVGGVAGELVLLTIAAPVAQILDAFDVVGPGSVTVLLVMMAAVWPLGSAAYAAQTADDRGLNPFVAGAVGGAGGIVAMGVASLLVLGSGCLSSTASSDQVATGALGAAGALVLGSVLTGVVTGVAAAVTD